MSQFEFDEGAQVNFYLKKLQERIRLEEEQLKIEAALPKKFIGSGEDIPIFSEDFQ